VKAPAAPNGAVGPEIAPVCAPNPNRDPNQCSGFQDEKSCLAAFCDWIGLNATPPTAQGGMGAGIAATSTAPGNAPAPAPSPTPPPPPFGVCVPHRIVPTDCSQFRQNESECLAHPNCEWVQQLEADGKLLTDCQNGQIQPQQCEDFTVADCPKDRCHVGTVGPKCPPGSLCPDYLIEQCLPGPATPPNCSPNDPCPSGYLCQEQPHACPQPIVCPPNAACAQLICDPPPLTYTCVVECGEKFGACLDPRDTCVPILVACDPPVANPPTMGVGGTAPSIVCPPTTYRCEPTNPPMCAGSGEVCTEKLLCCSTNTCPAVDATTGEGRCPVVDPPTPTCNGVTVLNIGGPAVNMNTPPNVSCLDKYADCARLTGDPFCVCEGADAGLFPAGGPTIGSMTADPSGKYACLWDNGAR
jgi:hypothetical protein